MGNFFDEGGVGMYPTALFGIASLALAIVYAVKPRAQLFPLVTGTGAAALLAGALGMMIGFKSTVAAIAGREAMPPEQVQRVMLGGLYESANNLVLALALTTLVALALGVGGFRAKRVATA